MVTPAVVLAVDELPEHNTGMMIQEVGEFISDDAAIIACLLPQWGIRSGLIGTALGDDSAGRRVADRRNALGAAGLPRFSRDIKTPFEVNISDPTGARTYFWERKPEILATLGAADLSLLAGARLLYVDWYDGDHILRPMNEAMRRGIPVFLNLEYGHQGADILDRYAQKAAVCQAITDPAQRGGDPVAVARKLLKAGAGTALVTLGSEGCLAMRCGEALQARAPAVRVVDGCAAGAAFSAGFAYGHLKGWGLEEAVRFATAAGSLNCTVVGPRAFSLSEVCRLAAQVQVQRLTP
jgi:sugar/nucleoside kinase (ribokinase family)